MFQKNLSPLEIAMLKRLANQDTFLSKYFDFSKSTIADSHTYLTRQGYIDMNTRGDYLTPKGIRFLRIRRNVHILYFVLITLAILAILFIPELKNLFNL